MDLGPPFRSKAARSRVTTDRLDRAIATAAEHPQGIASEHHGETVALSSKALCLEVRYPHDRNGTTFVKRLLLRALVASPAEILFCSKTLSFLIDPHLALKNMTDHRIGHRRAGGFRPWLHDDVAHRNGLEAWDHGRTLAIGAHHNTRPRTFIFSGESIRGLRETRFDQSSRSSSDTDLQR